MQTQIPAAIPRNALVTGAARRLGRAIALELQAELATVEGLSSVEVAGAGYLNVKLDRAEIVRRIAECRMRQ